MTGGKTVNPHMLRHWYATDMIRRGVNPEVVRRQMRHKNVSVTLKIYTQVRSEEIEASLPNRLRSQSETPMLRNSNILEFKKKALR
jgi:site-specific recombinase XerD